MSRQNHTNQSLLGSRKAHRAEAHSMRQNTQRTFGGHHREVISNCLGYHIWWSEWSKGCTYVRDEVLRNGRSQSVWSVEVVLCFQVRRISTDWSPSAKCELNPLTNRHSFEKCLSMIVSLRIRCSNAQSQAKHRGQRSKTRRWRRRLTTLSDYSPLSPTETTHREFVIVCGCGHSHSTSLIFVADAYLHEFVYDHDAAG